MFGGEWKRIMLGDPWKENEKHHFHLSSLSPQTNFT
jgi:hypothetical protein